MGQIGISVLKRTAFRDAVQHFSNTYHYGSVNANPDAATAESLLDEVVAAEKTFHSTDVTFVHGRVWSSGGSIAENAMIFEKALTGTGSMTVHAGLDKERAYLIQWSAGIDSRGKPVKLRKWFHACGFMGAHSLSGNITANISGFTPADRATIAAKADVLTRISGLEEWGLVAESGRERDGGPPEAHRYLEHHQMGDEWRG